MRRVPRVARLVIGVLLILSASLPPGQVAASGGTFAGGDLVIGGWGRVYWWYPDGSVNRTLSTGYYDEVTGLAFDAAGNLYATIFGNDTVLKFDPEGNLLGSFGSGHGGPESIDFDSAGNVYIGEADLVPTQILKFSPEGTLLQRFYVEREDRGADWIDLAADECTMFYTSEGKRVLRFDVCTNTQLPDFNSALPGTWAWAMKLLPDGGALIANEEFITRLDSAGQVVGTYDVPGLDGWWVLALDPDERSFWAAEYWGQAVYRFDLVTGDLIQSFGTDESDVLGLAVKPGLPCGPLPGLPNPDRQLEPTVGSTSGPGGTLSLTVNYHQSVSWSGPEWRRVGDLTWQSQGGSGAASPGASFQVDFQVPSTPGAYEVRVGLVDAQGSRTYTDTLQLTLPSQPELNVTPGSQANILASWRSSDSTCFSLQRSTAGDFSTDATDDLVYRSTAISYNNGLNAISNGSFEWGVDAQGNPLGWSRMGTGSVEIDHTESRWGPSSVRFSRSTAGTDELVQQIFVGPGLSSKPVLVSTWVKTDNIAGPGEGATVWIRFLDRSGNPLNYWFWSVWGTYPWSRMWVWAEVPEGTWSIEVRVGLYGSTGTAWFDGLQAEPAYQLGTAFSPGLRVGKTYYYRALAWHGPLWNASPTAAGVVTEGFPLFPGRWNEPLR